MSVRISSKTCCFFTLFFLFFHSLEGQNLGRDSLSKYSYEELKTKFDESLNSKSIYAKEYLNRAKNNNDTLNIARGYKFYTFLVSTSDAIKYSDSVIKISINSKHRSYPTKGYLLKAYYLYQKGNYKSSLDNYISALPIAIKKENFEHQLDIRQAIGTLKSRMGDHEEALKIFKEHLNNIKSYDMYDSNHKKNYLLAIFNISDTYLDIKRLDSANAYIQKGVIESLKLNDSVFYYDFVAASGHSKYHNGKYQEALNLLNSATPHLDGYSLGVNFYYKGKCYQYMGNTKKMFIEFEKADSIYKIDKDLFPELRNIYESFIDHYKKNNKVKKQLFYLEKLIFIDSILNSQQNYLSSEIVKKYDTQILLKEQERLKNKVKSLHIDNIRSNRGLIVSLIVVAIIITFLIYYYQLQLKYKRKFIETIEKSKKLKTNTIKKAYSTTTKNKIGISQEIINQTLLKLQEFENQKKFLKSDIKAASLAKEFGTNTTYLSKIINEYRGKNFSTYLKELRVNYAIEQLRINPKFRKYSIKAIAYEIGFNNVDYFSKAFFKTTGIQPSYFIKQIEKQEKNTHNL